MSYDGQAPQPGGYPPQGPPPQTPQGQFPGQPEPYAQQPGQYAPQPGQQAPAPQQGQPGQPGAYAPGYQQPGQYPPAQQGQYPPAQQGQYPPQGPYGQQQAPQAPAAPRPNPLKGMPVADMVRDGVAAFLLLISLALPVTAKGGIGEGFNFIVTIVTIVSVLSLALPYLARGGILPPTWTVHQTRTVRMLANAPYAVVVVLYLVFDLAKIGGYETAWASSPPGLGTALALGLAGAVLAAQPRESEMGPEHADVDGPKTWRLVTLGLAGLAALTLLLSLVFFLVNSGDFADYLGFVYILQGALGILLLAGFVLWPAYGVLVQKTQSWRTFTMCLGVVVAVAMLFGISSTSSIVRVVSFHGSVVSFTLSLGEGVGGLFFLAFAAAVASPAFRRTLAPSTPQESWIGVLVHTLDYVAVVAGITAVDSILTLGFKGDGKPTGSIITMFLLSLVIAGGAVYARLTFAKSPANGKVFVLAEAGLALVLGIVLLIVVPDGGLAAGHLVLAFGLPLVLVFALFAPKEMRTYFVENRPSPRADAQNAFQWTAPQGQAPAGYQHPGQGGGQPQAYGAPAPQAPYGAPVDQAQYGAPAPQAGYGAPAEQAQFAPQHTQAGHPAPADQGQPYAQPPVGQMPYAAPQGQYVAPVQQQPAQHAPSAAPEAPVAQQPAAPQAQAYEAPQAPAAPVQQPAQTTAGAPAVHVVNEPNVQAPVAAPQEAPEATHGYTAQQALDPATTGLVLSQIVQDAPELRPQVAANPATYPALLDWLGQLNDPEVDAALRNRQS